jgi:hypothetical protein
MVNLFIRNDKALTTSGSAKALTTSVRAKALTTSVRANARISCPVGATSY